VLAVVSWSSFGGAGRVNGSGPIRLEIDLIIL
jgi:hypothetical protein